jgi:hypothetical protein
MRLSYPRLVVYGLSGYYSPYHDEDAERQLQCCTLLAAGGTPGCAVRGGFAASRFVQVLAAGQPDTSPPAAGCSQGVALGLLVAISNSAQKYRYLNPFTVTY